MSIDHQPTSFHGERTIAYSIVIPVYRSSTTLPELLKRLQQQLSALNENYEIILVEDCGGDNSWHVLESLLQQYENIQLVQLSRNYGQHNALMCGFSFCRGNIVITMDDDLQNPPEEIPKLINALTEEFDVIYGVPEKRNHQFFRNIGSYLIRAFYKKVFRVDVDLTSFRIIRKAVVEGVLRYNKNFTFIDGLLAWHTSRIGEVQVRHDVRKEGVTGYSIKKLVTLTFNMLTNFSIAPLQIATVVGLLFSLFGFSLAAWFLTQYLLYGIPVPGFTSIIVSVTVFSGVQMLTLGLIGEYLGRIHMNINSKPQYSIRNHLVSANIAQPTKNVEG